MWLESVRSRVVYRSLDAVLTASLRPHRAVSANLRSVVSPRSSNYERVGSLVCLVDGLVPGTARRAGFLLQRGEVELLAYGSGATVFRFNDDGRPRVLKVYRRTLGLGPAALREQLDVYRGRYERIRDWYDGIEGLVWPAEYRITPAPLLGRPAVAGVQDYIEDAPTDLMSVLGAEDRAAVLAGDRLRSQIVAFAERTAEVFRSERAGPDLLGLNNLAIYGDGGDRRLHLIDYGVFGSRDAGERTPGRLERIEECIGQLVSVARDLENPGGERCIAHASL